MGHLLRKMDEKGPKKSLKEYTERGRPVGSPRERWTDTVNKDAKNMLKCKNRRRLAEERDVWRQGLESLRPRLGCSAKGGEEYVKRFMTYQKMRQIRKCYVKDTFVGQENIV